MCFLQTFPNIISRFEVTLKITVVGFSFLQKPGWFLLVYDGCIFVCANSCFLLSFFRASIVDLVDK